jgi:beta-glucosidase
MALSVLLCASVALCGASAPANSPYPAEERSPLKPISGEYVDLNKNGRKDPYEDPSLPIERRIDDLLSKMTVEEKTCQMATLYGYPRVLKDDLPTEKWKSEVWKDGIANIDEHLNGWRGARDADAEGKVANNPNYWPPANHAKAINTVQRWFVEQTRLGIPVDFSNEGIRGLAHWKATCFPSQNGMGNTWNRALVRRQGEIVGAEARALGYSNVYSPIMDVSRDQRWGRNEDCYGESAFLAGELGVQHIQGLQSQGVASSVKHFALYSIPKGGREGQARTDPEIGPRRAEDELLYAFKRAFRDGRAKGTMSSYNDYDGVPISGDSYWLIDKLRGEYGFRGYIISDSEAVEFLHNKHHTAATYKEAVRQTVMGGLNVRTTFKQPVTFIEPLRELVKEGSIPMQVIDDRVRDVLRVKYQLGLFDRPYVNESAANDSIMKPESLAVALQASRESMVLLKNEKNTLPLKKAGLKKVLVCGPNADDKWHAVTRYGPSQVDVVTPLSGIRAKLEGTGAEVTYVKGCDFTDANWPASEVMPEPMTNEEKRGIDEAVAAAKGADVAIVVVGDGPRTTGEAKSRTSLDLPGRQLDLIKAIHATGTPVVLVLINGRPHTINWPAKHVPAIVCASVPGAQGGTAIADVLFGDYNPGGKLTNTWPKTVGQIPMNFPTKPNAQWESEKAANVAGMLYAFGHGLSYTTFAYENLRVRPERGDVFTTSGDIIAEVDVKNTGAVAGDEVVQLYHRDLVSSVTTYEQNLVGFERVHFESGEQRTVTMRVPNELLSLINRENQRVVEPGEFKFMVGGGSADIRKAATINVVEAK